jgi:hypothetical protein
MDHDMPLANTAVGATGGVVAPLLMRVSMRHIPCLEVRDQTRMARDPHIIQLSPRPRFHGVLPNELVKGHSPVKSLGPLREDFDKVSCARDFVCVAGSEPVPRVPDESELELPSVILEALDEFRLTNYLVVGLIEYLMDNIARQPVLTRYLHAGGVNAKDWSERHLNARTGHLRDDEVDE